VVAEIEQRTKDEEDAARRVAGRHVDRSRQPGPEPKPENDLAPLQQEDQDPFLGWLEKRQSTLLWQVATRVLELRRRERARAEQAHRALAETGAPSTTKLEEAKRFLVVCWGVTLAAAALLGLVTALRAVEDPWGFLSALPRFDWVDLIRVLLVVGVVLLTAGTLYFQAMRSYEWAVTRRMHALQQASDDYVTARHQERRWQLMQSGLADWAQVLGELLHRPWAPPRPQQQDLPAYAGLPAAVAVAVPVDPDAGADFRSVGRAIEHVCQKGWLAEEFGRLVAASPANDPEVGVQLREGDLPADLDLGLRPVGPRRELVELAGRASTKQAATRHLLDEVSSLLHSGDVRLPPHTVVRVGSYSEGETMLDREFLQPRDQVAPFVTEVFTPAAQLAKYQVPERTVFCLPAGGDPPRSLAAALHADISHCGESAAIRVDVSPLVSHDNISLFQRIRRPEPRPTTSPDDFN
jgi:hypothetical protein